MTKTFISEFTQQENVKQNRFMTHKCSSHEGNVKQKHHMIYKHVSCEFKQHEHLQKKKQKRSHDTNTF